MRDLTETLEIVEREIGQEARDSVRRSRRPRVFARVTQALVDFVRRRRAGEPDLADDLNSITVPAIALMAFFGPGLILYFG